MAALTKDRDTKARSGQRYGDPVAAGAVIFAGAMVALNASGYAVPASTATGLTGRGRALESVDNSGGAAGAVAVPVERGVFCFANNGEVTRAHINGKAYAVDDQTVAPTDGTGTRSAVGTIRDLDVFGVWVEF
ncbi:MAG: hypothetical protein ACP59X_09895 [Solidesulfovibrio sp. DCME]|uniref:hypothetical protein n=1 Tax=Solidesulfovibrio sp. DCME TaxID=3447380 RepID=UPI003D0BD8BB